MASTLQTETTRSGSSSPQLAVKRIKHIDKKVQFEGSQTQSNVSESSQLNDSQGKSQSSELDRSDSLSPTATLGSDADSEFIIKRNVSDWRAGFASFSQTRVNDADGTFRNLDVLQDDYLPVNLHPEELLISDFFEVVSKHNPTSSFPYIRDHDVTVKEGKCLDMLAWKTKVNIQPNKYQLPDEVGDNDVPSSHSRFRSKLAFGGWPRVDSNIYKETVDDINSSRSELASFRQSLYLASGAMASDQVDHEDSLQSILMSSAANGFVDEVWRFLHDQPILRKNSLASLFTSFASVVGLKFRIGNAIFPREMTVLGNAVKAECDLRAYAVLTESQSKSHQNKVAAVVEVKAEPPRDVKGETWLSNLGCSLIGQMLGEMLLELPHSATPGYMAGFCVQSTKVRFVLLHLPAEAMDYITNPPKSEKGRPRFRGRYGTMYFSQGVDILMQHGRLKLWKLLLKLVKSTSAVKDQAV